MVKSPILTLTATERAANLLQRRISILGPIGISAVAQSCRSFAMDALIESGGQFKILSPPEESLLLRKLLESEVYSRYNMGNYDDAVILNLLNHFHRLQDMAISPKEYTMHFQCEGAYDKIISTKQLELARLYTIFQEEKCKRDFLSFRDIILRSTELVENNPIAAESFANRFKYIMLDELQDLSPLAFKFLNLLISVTKFENILISGDDNQSIFSFRGARFGKSHYRTFCNQFPGAKTFSLDESFRSHGLILRTTKRLISRNQNEFDSSSIPVPKHFSRWRSLDDPVFNKIKEPRHYLLETDQEEIQLIAKLINRLTNDFKVFNPRDIAILARTKFAAQEVADGLSNLAVPVNLTGTIHLSRYPEIRMLLSFLYVSFDPQNNIALFDFLTSPAYGLHSGTISRIVDTSKKNSYSTNFLISRLQNYVESVSKDPFSHHSHINLVKMILHDIEHFSSRISEVSAVDLVISFLKHRGMHQLLMKTMDTDSEDKALRISHFIERLAQIERSSGFRSASLTIPHIYSLEALGETFSMKSPDSELEMIDNLIDAPDRVNILTMHRSKGLEFPCVIIPRCIEEEFPGIIRHRGMPLPYELVHEYMVSPSLASFYEEERRLGYVAMSTARDCLFLTSAKYYKYYSQRKSVRASSFVDECLKLKNIEVFDRATSKTKLENISVGNAGNAL